MSHLVRKRIFIDGINPSLSSHEAVRLLCAAAGASMDNTRLHLALDSADRSLGFAVLTMAPRATPDFLALHDCELCGHRLAVRWACEKPMRRPCRWSVVENGARTYQSCLVEDKVKALAPFRYRMVDCGVYLTDASFKFDLETVLARAVASGIERMVVKSKNLAESEEAAKLSVVFNGNMLFTTGVHPAECRSWTEDSKSIMRSLLRQPACVAVGECGLDFTWLQSERDCQLDIFEAQVDLACEMKKPLIVYEKNAHEAVWQALERRADKGILPPTAIFTFSKEPAVLDRYLARNYYILITGYTYAYPFESPISTWLKTNPSEDKLARLLVASNAPRDCVEFAARALEHHRLTLLTHEAECAALTHTSLELFQSITPSRNEPASLACLVELVAAQAHMSANKMASLLFANAQRFFQLDALPPVPDQVLTYSDSMDVEHASAQPVPAEEEHSETKELVTGTTEGEGCAVEKQTLETSAEKGEINRSFENDEEALRVANADRAWREAEEEALPQKDGERPTSVLEDETGTALSDREKTIAEAEEAAYPRGHEAMTIHFVHEEATALSNAAKNAEDVGKTPTDVRSEDDKAAASVHAASVHSTSEARSPRPENEEEPVHPDSHKDDASPRTEEVAPPIQRGPEVHQPGSEGEAPRMEGTRTGAFRTWKEEALNPSNEAIFVTKSGTIVYTDIVKVAVPSGSSGSHAAGGDESYAARSSHAEPSSAAAAEAGMEEERDGARMAAAFSRPDGYHGDSLEDFAGEGEEEGGEDATGDRRELSEESIQAVVHQEGATPATDEGAQSVRNRRLASHDARRSPWSTVEERAAFETEGMLEISADSEAEINVRGVYDEETLGGDTVEDTHILPENEIDIMAHEMSADIIEMAIRKAEEAEEAEEEYWDTTEENIFYVAQREWDSKDSLTLETSGSRSRGEALEQGEEAAANAEARRNGSVGVFQQVSDKVVYKTPSLSEPAPGSSTENRVGFYKTSVTARAGLDPEVKSRLDSYLHSLEMDAASEPPSRGHVAELRNMGGLPYRVWRSMERFELGRERTSSEEEDLPPEEADVCHVSVKKRSSVFNKLEDEDKPEVLFPKTPCPSAISTELPATEIYPECQAQSQVEESSTRAAEVIQYLNQLAASIATASPQPKAAAHGVSAGASESDYYTCRGCLNELMHEFSKWETSYALYQRKAASLRDVNSLGCTCTCTCACTGDTPLGAEGATGWTPCTQGETPETHSNTGETTASLSKLAPPSTAAKPQAANFRAYLSPETLNSLRQSESNPERSGLCQFDRTNRSSLQDNSVRDAPHVLKPSREATNLSTVPTLHVEPTRAEDRLAPRWPSREFAINVAMPPNYARQVELPSAIVTVVPCLEAEQLERRAEVASDDLALSGLQRRRSSNASTPDGIQKRDSAAAVVEKKGSTVGSKTSGLLRDSSGRSLSTRPSAELDGHFPSRSSFTQGEQPAVQVKREASSEAGQDPRRGSEAAIEEGHPPRTSPLLAARVAMLEGVMKQRERSSSPVQSAKDSVQASDVTTAALFSVEDKMRQIEYALVKMSQNPEARSAIVSTALAAFRAKTQAMTASARSQENQARQGSGLEKEGLPQTLTAPTKTQSSQQGVAAPHPCCQPRDFWASSGSIASCVAAEREARKEREIAELMAKFRKLSSQERAKRAQAGQATSSGAQAEDSLERAGNLTTEQSLRQGQGLGVQSRRRLGPRAPRHHAREGASADQEAEFSTDFLTGVRTSIPRGELDNQDVRSEAGAPSGWSSEARGPREAEGGRQRAGLWPILVMLGFATTPFTLTYWLHKSWPEILTYLSQLTS